MVCGLLLSDGISASASAIQSKLRFAKRFEALESRFWSSEREARCTNTLAQYFGTVTTRWGSNDPTRWEWGEERALVERLPPGVLDRKNAPFSRRLRIGTVQSIRLSLL